MPFLKFNGICYSLFYTNGHFKISFFIVKSEINQPTEIIYDILSHTYLYEEVENFTVSDNKIYKDNLSITFLGRPHHIIFNGRDIKSNEKNFNESYLTLLKYFTERDNKMLDDHIIKHDTNIIVNSKFDINQDLQIATKSTNKNILHLDDDQLEMEKKEDNILVNPDIKKKVNILQKVKEQKKINREENKKKMKKKIENVETDRVKKEAILLTLKDMEEPINTNREPTKDFTKTLKKPRRLKKRRTYYKRK